MAPKEYVEVSLDTATLKGAQLQPAVAGTRTLPRPSEVEMADFPLVLTGEIDGTV
ncbi:hypothetical protein [Pelagerythrobacter rhizovicinus]|uniref:hypothetical protein n=1 Tax=Pelagerythrobacter rhizovicinus TaxID=2268576 RepID=UPI0013EDD556|nr:hypothetical protein [Pelagerythrobacter rhizovicinus]